MSRLGETSRYDGPTPKSAGEWLDLATPRDRMLVWQRDDPYDVPLPDDATERVVIRHTLDAEFGTECGHESTWPANEDGEIVCRECWAVVR